jgi:CubicO group peptidase (beta-lactamase class C family)
VHSQSFTNLAEKASPGCALGVNENGEPVFRDAYGLANLEHGVPVATDTIMEAGSISKQFTAAAAIVLALDGKLSLSDDIRKYLPELPEYEASVQIRHLINHTNGLRDWGHIADIEGWPRGTRAYHQDDVLSIVSRQRSLNYKPGEIYNYGNSGYNLLTIIVARVSGMSFPEFTQTRLFEPLGMTNTSWRDDFTRVVPNRANAYRPSGEEYVLNMPFEDTYGHGGLLTTVDDLLKWNHNLQTGQIGGQAFIDEMHRPGKLNDGTVTSYASGLMLESRQGLEVVSHGGTTAGYRGFAAHYPEKNITVAALCNDGTGQVYRVAGEAVSPYVGISEALESGTSNEAPPTPIEQFAGAYKNVSRGDAIHLVSESGQLRFANGPLLQWKSGRHFSAGRQDLYFDTSSPETAFEYSNFEYAPFRFVKMPDFVPTNEQLAEYTGTYTSDDSEAVLTLSLRNGALSMNSGMARNSRLTPVYQDAFLDVPNPRGQSRAPMTILFKRDEVGRIQEMDLITARVWRLTFTKMGR